jgi:death on curing protein
LESGVRHLGIEAVLQVHEAIVHATGEDPAILKPGEFKFCLDAVRDIASRQAFREALIRKAAYYFWCLNANHVFVAANKRTAFQTAYVFLRANGHDLSGLDPTETVVLFSNLARGLSGRRDAENWVRKSLSVVGD